MVGLQYFAIVGGALSTILAIKNSSGNRIYVMTPAEARNRLTVDFIEYLVAGIDKGIVAYLSDGSPLSTKYDDCGGIVACVDCQIRNRDSEGGGGKRYGGDGMPVHVYVKNMLVDGDMRQKGVGMALIEAVEEYGRSEGAVLSVLEVDKSNVNAVKLYEKAGYADEKIVMPDTKQKYGGFIIGRMTMMKRL